MSDGANSWIEVRRRWQFACFLRSIAISIDGLDVGKIRCGETKSFAVEPGDHRISVSMGSWGAHPLDITVAPGETHAVSTGSNLKGHETVKYWYFRTEDDCLFLKNVD
ncbi:MAG TPA: hypothetical protein V6C72_16075 [Chroococcales cyanobacterium]